MLLKSATPLKLSKAVDAGLKKMLFIKNNFLQIKIILYLYIVV
jgi:hypothetical protein